MFHLWAYSLLGNRRARAGAALGAGSVLALLVAVATGYWLGRSDQRSPLLLDLNRISTAASGTNMAVATGAVSDEAEGVFFLDFLTGDLQCLVYYPRSGAFGARYYTNIQAQMPPTGKSGQYLMVTGAAVSNRATSNVRPGNCLVYITDVTSGTFAAYTVPWNKSAESSSQAQLGGLIYVGGGPIRNYQINDNAAKKPAAKDNLNNPLNGNANANNANNNIPNQANANGNNANKANANKANANKDDNLKDNDNPAGQAAVDPAAEPDAKPRPKRKM